MWHRSTDEGSVAGAPLLLGAGVVVAVAIAVVAGLVAYGHGKSTPKSSAVDDVRKAYLAYSDATTEVSKQLSVAPVQPYVTDAGLGQANAILQNAERTGFRFAVTLTHDTQVALYSSGNLASVDDVMDRHTTPLDLATLEPAGPSAVDVIHESVALMRQGGAWLVDSAVAFGTAAAEGSLPISYAAEATATALSPILRSLISNTYRHYWDVYSQAVKTLDPAPLGTVEGDPLLTHDRSFIDEQRANDESYVVNVEHNFRVAQGEAASFWVYDTFADSSYHINRSTGKSIPAGPTEIIREGYEFHQAGQRWQLVSTTQYK